MRNTVPLQGSVRAQRPWFPRLSSQHVVSTSQEGLPDDSDGVRHLKVDVFAFGVTLWEMLTRQRPHHNLEGFEIQVCLLNTHVAEPGLNGILHIPSV